MNNVMVVGKKCMGCSSCVFSCPKKAVTFKKDVIGFSFPIVDANKCIDCGKCLARCPANNASIFLKPTKVFAANAIDKCANSSSGGIATLFILSFILSGGVVYCTYFSEKNQRFVFGRFTNERFPKKTSGSRYVQSDVLNSYSLCESDLKVGLNVLFLGTPCQIDGLIHFLNKQYQKLITIDILCHGVPSQKMLFNHLENIKNGELLGDILFRNKSEYCIRTFDCNGKILYKSKIKKDLFLEGFQEGRILRDSCFICKYSRFERVSDISLGDFWAKRFDDNLRDSVVLVNTSKGVVFFEQLRDKLDAVELQSNIDCIFKNNPALKKPVKKSFYRVLFLRYYSDNCDFDKAIIKSRPIKKRIIELVRRSKLQ